MQEMYQSPNTMPTDEGTIEAIQKSRRSWGSIDSSSRWNCHSEIFWMMDLMQRTDVRIVWRISAQGKQTKNVKPEPQNETESSRRSERLSSIWRGTLTIDEGDGLDANGSIEINLGRTARYGSNKCLNSLDYDDKWKPTVYTNPSRYNGEMTGFGRLPAKLS